MELRLFGISELRLEGWTVNNVAGISLYRNGAEVCFEAVGQSTVNSARGLTADVAGVVVIAAPFGWPVRVDIST